MGLFLLLLHCLIAVIPQGVIHRNTNNCLFVKQNESVVCVFSRSKDYTAPVNFVSAGLRKTAAEEKQQLKGEGGSDDSDGAPSAPSPPRATAPKKLQMVSFVMRAFFFFSTHCSVICNSKLYEQLYVLLKCIILSGKFPWEPVTEVCRWHTVWTRHW